jgi:hypothetical protein
MILQGDWRLISECSRVPRFFFFSPLRPHAVHRSCASCLWTVFSTYKFLVFVYRCIREPDSLSTVASTGR